MAARPCRPRAWRALAVTLSGLSLALRLSSLVPARKPVLGTPKKPPANEGSVPDPWGMLVGCAQSKVDSQDIDPTLLLVRKRKLRTPTFNEPPLSISSPPQSDTVDGYAVGSVESLPYSERLGAPRGVSLGANGTVYVADTIGCRIIRCSCSHNVFICIYA